MAESVVIFLLKNLSPLLEQELKLLGGVRGEVVFIRDELESMTALLRVADAMEESDLEFQIWVDQVRDVAYDTQDVLDEFTLRLARHHRRGFHGFLLKIYHPIRSLKARHQIASEIRDIKARVDNIAQRRQRYSNKYSTSDKQGSNPRASNNAWYDRRGDALLLEEADLVGIHKPKKQLINWLLDADYSRLKGISVVGMGGLGKTTLVKKVYEDTEVKRHFQNHAWITVSQSFNIKELLKDLIRQLFDEVRQPLPPRLETMNNDELKANIKYFLQQRRYVLILDDVWSIDAWNAIKYALPNHDCASRVLLTTRIMNVAIISCKESHGNIYEMKALSSEESWALFCKKTFQEKDCPPHLKELSESILRRCEGLPLAIVTIAGVLSSKDQKRVGDWELVNRTLGAEVEGSDMKKILLLSYNDLPYYLKSCFLYLCGFPEDHLIEWMRSIRLWIAEGFVEVKERKTLEEVAEAYLFELLNRSLIQVAERRKDERVRSCRIHDLLREIILSKSRNQNFVAVTGEGSMRWPEKVRRLFIHNASQNIPQGRRFSQLRSLLIFKDADPLSESLMPIFFNGGLKLLKVLELRGTSLETFPDEVVILFHLRYLSLRRTKVQMLPRSLGKLQNLETLDLKYTCVTELPVEILRLQQLRHLLLYDWAPAYTCWPFHMVRGFKAPFKIGGLQCLQKLCFVEANQVSGSTIVEEIARLTQLRKLGIVKLRKEDGEALCSSIKKLSNLRSLYISSTEEDEILDLQSLSPAPKLLQRLYLSGRLEKFPYWIASLHDLARLYLRWSKLRGDLLKPLQGLSNLVELELDQSYEEEGLCLKAGGFQRLKILALVHLKGLRWVRVEKGTMPYLERLYIYHCELVEELPSGIEHLTNLKLLELSDVSDRLISRLNHRDPVQAGDYQKIAHIPRVWIGDTEDGHWKGEYL